MGTGKSVQVLGLSPKRTGLGVPHGSSSIAAGAADKTGEEKLRRLEREVRATNPVKLEGKVEKQSRINWVCRSEVQSQDLGLGMMVPTLRKGSGARRDEGGRCCWLGVPTLGLTLSTRSRMVEARSQRLHLGVRSPTLRGQNSGLGQGLGGHTWESKVTP